MRLRQTRFTLALAWTACLTALVATASCSDDSDDSDGSVGPLDGGAGAAGSAAGSGGSAGGGGGDAQPRCGNGVTEPGEQCDDGSNTPGSGCEPNCTTSCQDDSSCDDELACNGVEACTAVSSGKRCTAGAALADGVECGSDPRRICKAGACIDSACGDGVVDGSSGEQCEPPNTATCTATCRDIVCGDGRIEGPEQCDDGTNAAGSGCEPDCTFSCEQAADCNDGNVCNGTETCEPVTAGRRCAAGTAPAEGFVCASRSYCRDAQCVAAVCGNDQIEPTESCEPPNTSSCSSECQTVVCGDGVVAGDEQCDDANSLRLDGCAPDCRYEMVSRFTSMVIQAGPAPAHCKHANSRERGNAYGVGFTELALINSNSLIAEAINGGASNIMSIMFGLDDTTGLNDSNVQIGVVEGALDLRHPGTFTPGAVDWWFKAASSTLDENDMPLDVLTPASIVGGILNAGPSRVRVSLKLGEIIHPVELLDTQVRTRAAPTPPNRPAPPPAELASGFTIYETTLADGTDEGLCAYLSVDSLSKFPVPRQFTSGESACNPGCANSAAYVACPSGEPAGPSCNSLLDVFVTGCAASVFCTRAVNPIQPDVGGDGNPPATLTPGPGNKVTPVVPNDGYSIYFKFTMHRAHLTNNL